MSYSSRWQLQERKVHVVFLLKWQVSGWAGFFFFWPTCKAPYRPGIHNNVTQLETQFVYSKLDHDIHRIRLVLGKRNPLKHMREK